MYPPLARWYAISYHREQEKTRDGDTFRWEVAV